MPVALGATKRTWKPEGLGGAVGQPWLSQAALMLAARDPRSIEACGAAGSKEASAGERKRGATSESTIDPSHLECTRSEEQLGALEFSANGARWSLQSGLFGSVMSKHTEQRLPSTRHFLRKFNGCDCTNRTCCSQQ